MGLAFSTPPCGFLAFLHWVRFLCTVSLSRFVRVRVKFFGDLYELIGTFKLELEVTNGLSIRDLIDLISHTFNPKFTEAVLDGDDKLKGEYVVLVNGKAIEWLNGLATKLNDDDEVVFLPPAEGG